MKLLLTVDYTFDISDFVLDTFQRQNKAVEKEITSYSPRATLLLVCKQLILTVSIQSTVLRCRLTFVGHAFRQLADRLIIGAEKSKIVGSRTFSHTFPLPKASHCTVHDLIRERVRRHVSNDHSKNPSLRSARQHRIEVVYNSVAVVQ